MAISKTPTFRQASQIGKADRPALTLRSTHENPRKIAWVVGNGQRPIEPAGPDAQHVIPLAKTEQVNAVAPHQPVDAGKEIDHETSQIVGMTYWSGTTGRGLMPGRQRWNSKRSMPIGVIAHDLERHPPLQLIHRHRRIGGGIVAAALVDVAERRAWQKMDSAHHGADQPFDVTTIVGCGDRTVDEFDAVFLSAAPQGTRPEFLGVVEMNRVRKPGDRPLRIDPQPGEP